MQKNENTRNQQALQEHPTWSLGPRRLVNRRELKLCFKSTQDQVRQQSKHENTTDGVMGNSELEFLKKKNVSSGQDPYLFPQESKS